MKTDAQRLLELEAEVELVRAQSRRAGKQIAEQERQLLQHTLRLDAHGDQLSAYAVDFAEVAKNLETIRQSLEGP